MVQIVRKNAAANRPRSYRSMILVMLFLCVSLLVVYNIRLSQSLVEMQLQIKPIASKRKESMKPKRMRQNNRENGNDFISPISNAVQDRIDEQSELENPMPESMLPPLDWDSDIPNNHLDLGVLISGQEEKLLRLAESYGEAIQKFRTKARKPVDFRLLVTRYPSDDSSEEFRQKLATRTTLSMDNIVFVESKVDKFNRAKARNLIHEHANEGDQSVLAMVDVDMWLGPRFLFNSLMKVNPGRMYFPIVFSNYRPSTVSLVEQFLGPQSRYSDHRGLWRVFGYGMYAIAGGKARSLTMDESFEGWGGEDTEYYQRAGQMFKIARGNEFDLIHRWHTKACELGEFVEADQLITCVRSRDALDGSTFGQFLARLNGNNPNSLLHHALSTSRVFSNTVARFMQSKLYRPYAKWQGRRRARKEVAHAIELGRHSSSQRNGAGDILGGILVGVTASRATFPTRVAEIMQTWGQELPKGVHVRFFVGDPAGETGIGSAEDIDVLARQAGIADKSTIVVMRGVKDDEYPLVDKAVSVLQYMRSEAEEISKRPLEKTIEWFFDVDDDTYVHLVALEEFLEGRDPGKHAYFGRRGTGAVKDSGMMRKRGVLTKPFCMGGPGILMSRVTIRLLLDNIGGCLQEADQVLDEVYDDVLFGICLQKHAGLGCWDDAPSYSTQRFAHDFNKSFRFPGNSRLHSTISLHPHKTAGSMTRSHQRFVKFGRSKPSWAFF